MSNLLSTAKKVLKEQAIDLYSVYEEDLPFDRQEYKMHYSNLGEILFEIDSITLFSEMISKMEFNFFSQLGYHSDDEDMIERFIKEVKEGQ